MSIVVVFVGSVISKCSEDSRPAAAGAVMTEQERALRAKEKAAERAKKREQETLQNAIYACRSFVTKRLRDPDSAKFELPEDSFAALEKGVYHVQVDVRAKNGFGGYNMSVWDCKMKLGGDQWTLVSLSEIN